MKTINLSKLNTFQNKTINDLIKVSIIQQLLRINKTLKGRLYPHT